jgi:ABC-type sulfate transport system substrate-binding protein
MASLFKNKLSEQGLRSEKTLWRLTSGRWPGPGSVAQAAPTLLNVSYDVMRDFYKDYNTAFQKHWQAEHNENITLQMSFGGSSKQARSVIDGLPADVITMNMATDINALATTANWCRTTG